MSDKPLENQPLKLSEAEFIRDFEKVISDIEINPQLIVEIEAANGHKFVLLSVSEYERLQNAISKGFGESA